jgi:hypothetical protein
VNLYDFLTTELVLGALLVTSFTSMGLIALWAATSRWHWFVRWAVVLATLSPLLAVPPYEPFLIFALQAGVIVAGVKLWPYLKRVRTVEVPNSAPAHGDPSRALRFVLRTLLLASPIVAVLALLSPFVLFPLYGPVVIFAFEASAILAGVIVALAARRVWSRIKRTRFLIEKPPPSGSAHHRPFGPRFSLRTLLLMTPILAVVIAMGAQIAMHLGPQTSESITTALLNGAGSGLAVLLAAWMTVTKRKAIVWPLALALCLGVAAILAWFDWLFPAFTRSTGWPPDKATILAFFGVLRIHPQLAWLLVLPAVMLLSLIAIVLYRFAQRPWKSKTAWPSLPRLASQGTLMVVSLALVAFPSYVLWQLLHPLPLPHYPMPDPNGFEVIAAAGNAFSGSPILNTSVEPQSTSELAAEIAKHQEAYDQLRVGLAQDMQVQFWPTRPEELDASLQLSLNAVQAARSAARGLMREAELAEQQERFDDAVRISFDNVRLGVAMPRNGLLVDYLVGIAIEGIGQHSLYQVIQHLEPDQCQSAIKTLAKLEADREPLDEVILRDRIWSQHAYGWFGHLMQIFEDLAPRWKTAVMVRHALNRTQTVSRLLTVGLAIRAYRVKHEEIPHSLSDLVPDYLEKIPIDPFDPAGGPLRFVRRDETYIIYSVGDDGVDNGGTAKELGRYPSHGEDLRLDVYMADPPPAATPTPTVEEPAADWVDDENEAADARNLRDD